jgi:predicted patatin/cPLA2 family phospholipase
MEFHVVATDCATGKPVYRCLDRADEEAFRWIQASASMPLVSRPVAIDGGEYLDGGLSDGIPLRYFELLGYDRNVVITTRPHGYRKFPKRRMCLLKPFLRRYPAIYKALKSRHVWYNETLEYIDSRVAVGAAFLIAPERPLEISRVCHDSDTMQRVYEAGQSTGKRYLDEVRYFLSGR